MKKGIFFTLMILGICLSIHLIACSSKIKVEAIKIVDYGLYEREITKRVKTEYGAADFIKNVKLVEKTEKIPAKIGTSFGLQFLVEGKPKGEAVVLKIVLLFPQPGLRNPKTDKIYHKLEGPNKCMIGETSYTGFEFEQEWNLVPGEWKIQLWYNDKMMAEKAFSIYKP
jgi:hypothetical protein